MQKKVLVALSGGVDSGVAAALLVQQGYEVVGVHLKLESSKGGMGGEGGNKCCDSSSFGRVVSLCEQLKIPLKVLDFSEKFANVVIHDFLDNYRRGLTPNPCVVCNKEVKIGGLLKWALENRFDYLATGHYARVGKTEDGIQKTDGRKQKTEDGDGFCLRQAVDKKKDQSYFLWTLTSAQIAHLLFPVGEMSKEEVRSIAAKLQLPVAAARESFDVCFIPDRVSGSPILRQGRTDIFDSNLAERQIVGDDKVKEGSGMTTTYLRQHLPSIAFKQGDVVNQAGEAIGCHFGLPLYTIGQHRGFLANSKECAGQVLYVVRKEVGSNKLVVGRKEEAEKRQFTIYNLQFSIKDLSDLTVRIRHQGRLLPVESLSEGINAQQGLATLFTRRKNVSDGLSESLNSDLVDKLKVVLAEPVLGVAPGQSAVFYQGEELVGGGVIC